MKSLLGDNLEASGDGGPHLGEVVFVYGLPCDASGSLTLQIGKGKDTELELPAIASNEWTINGWTMLPQRRVYRPRAHAFLRLVVATLLAISAGLLVASLTGCQTTAKSEREVIVEGRALLRHPAPGDPQWEIRRLTFFADAELFAPSASSSADTSRTPTPTSADQLPPSQLPATQPGGK